MFTEDLAPFFLDFGLPAAFGGNTATVLLDMPDQAILGDMQLSTEYAMFYKSGDLPGLKHGDTGTVGGTTYTVREIAAQDDGKTLRAALKK